MAKRFDDLLADDFVAPEQQAPRSVLDELASVFNRKVVYKLQFRVSTTSSAGRAIHGLIVELSKIDYALELLKVSHDVLQLYPVKLSGTLVSPTQEAASEDELVAKLSEVMKSEKATSTIGTLLAQA